MIKTSLNILAWRLIEMEQRKTALITDSASDITKELADNYGIPVIPLRLLFSHGEYKDRVEITPDTFYPMLTQEIPKSSLPARDDVTGALDDLSARGVTDVLYIGISSGLSGTFQAVKQIGEEYEGIRFTAFDSKILSCGEGALVEAAAKELSVSGSIEKAVALVQSIRERMSSFFVVKTLNYLSKGGRIGKVAGTVGSLLHLSPVITVNSDGVYETAAKTIGFDRAIDLMVRQMETRFAGRSITLSCVHAQNEEGTLRVIDKIKRFADVKSATVTPVTAVLGAHTGPGLVGMIAYEI